MEAEPLISGDLIGFTQREVNNPHPSATFAGVAKASSFQSRLELTVEYTHKVTLQQQGILRP